MAELPRSEQRPQKPVRWPRRALAFVLAFVSENSETFASHSRTSGFRSLTEQLNAIVRPDKPYEASHVRSKFESIWRNSGHNADGTVEPLYQFGVHWATLPGLEQKENVTFQDVRDAIEDLRLRDQTYRKTSSRESRDRTVYSKSKNRGNALIRPWVIKCLCPFDTEDGGKTVQCEGCKTWQHMFCYYEANIDPHFCADCADAHTHPQAAKASLNPETDIISGLGDLSLAGDGDGDLEATSRGELLTKVRQLEEHAKRQRINYHAQRRQIVALQAALDREKTMGTFTTFRSIDLAHSLADAPTDFGMRRTIESVSYLLGQLITNLPWKHGQSDIDKLLRSGIDSPDLVSALGDCLGMDLSKAVARRAGHSRAQLTGLDSLDLLRYLIWTMIRQWVFYSEIFKFDQDQSPISNVVNACIYERDGPVAFTNLQYAAWCILTEDGSSWFENTIKRLASELSIRCIKALAPLISSELGGSLDDTTVLSSQWQVTRDYLEKMLAACIKLRGRLPLRRAMFQLYLPSPGTRYDASFMEPDRRILDLDVSRQSVIVSTGPAFLYYRAVENRGDEQDSPTISRVSECMVHHESFEEAKAIIPASVIL